MSLARGHHRRPDGSDSSPCIPIKVPVATLLKNAVSRDCLHRTPRSAILSPYPARLVDQREERERVAVFFVSVSVSGIGIWSPGADVVLVDTTAQQANHSRRWKQWLHNEH
ncbi:hypothetical protein GX51_00147 [Blastomyces parvus]|uniref:Uncharacterized protein n=1 Tax=Blastomyces parvus TaxID=2060905 RepID=A0A2B7XN47_9EURO|nr:hypothetical protein GX51_00147 [Blastomyces parvus]